MSAPWQGILDFWIGPLDDEGLAAPEQTQKWFKKDPAFDEEIRERFLAVHQKVVGGEHEDWLEDPRGRLACIIVVDQFSRNMFRDRPEMYAWDDRCQTWVLEGLELGVDQRLKNHERVFFYMPLMHSEKIEHQRKCVELFTRFTDSLTGAARGRLSGNKKYAQAHLDIVERWGRFPHRNKILGRESSPQEIEFLKQPGSSF